MSPPLGDPRSRNPRLIRPQRMAKITYIQPDGTEQTVDGEPGMTVMEVAKTNLIEGIEAECGGACACATCHVYIDEAWREKTGTPEQMEEDMLDFAFEVRPESRLSCQIRITPELDGLIVRIPDKQF
jgi:2Fe-2S ferredoxin